MGLINFIQRVRAGKTDFQIEARYNRANSRSPEYNEVAQWYVENSDESPKILQDFAALQRMPFRQEHRAKLMQSRNDIERKLGHAQSINTRSNPWIAAFLRPEEMTVYLAYVLLRDDAQQYAVMTPYWFLGKGEREKDYKSQAFNVI